MPFVFCLQKKVLSCPCAERSQLQEEDEEEEEENLNQSRAFVWLSVRSLVGHFFFVPLFTWPSSRLIRSFAIPSSFDWSSVMRISWLTHYEDRPGQGQTCFEWFITHLLVFRSLTAAVLTRPILFLLFRLCAVVFVLTTFWRRILSFFSVNKRAATCRSHKTDFKKEIFTTFPPPPTPTPPPPLFCSSVWTEIQFDWFKLNFHLPGMHDHTVTHLFSRNLLRLVSFRIWLESVFLLIELFLPSSPFSRSTTASSSHPQWRPTTEIITWISCCRPFHLVSPSKKWVKVQDVDCWSAKHWPIFSAHSAKPTPTVWRIRPRRIVTFFWPTFWLPLSNKFELIWTLIDVIMSTSSPCPNDPNMTTCWTNWMKSLPFTIHHTLPLTMLDTRSALEGLVGLGLVVMERICFRSNVENDSTDSWVDVQVFVITESFDDWSRRVDPFKTLAHLIRWILFVRRTSKGNRMTTRICRELLLPLLNSTLPPRRVYLRTVSLTIRSTRASNLPLPTTCRSCRVWKTFSSSKFISKNNL